MMIKWILIILVVIGLAYYFGAFEKNDEKTELNVYDFETCAATGNPVMESYPRQCRYNGQTYAEESCSDENGNIISLGDAFKTAVESECGNNLVFECNCNEGYVKEGNYCTPKCYYEEPKCLLPSVECEKTYSCNEGTGAYWIEMSTKKQGCSPAWVVDVTKRTAEINWRCTGLSEQ